MTASNCAKPSAAPRSSPTKYRGIRLQLSNGLLKIQANNPEQEEAEEEVQVEYNGGNLEIGFSVSYLLDVLGVIGTEQVRFILFRFQQQRPGPRGRQ